MSKTTDLLDQIKTRYKIESKYALAKLLDIPEQYIGYFYKGERTPDDYAATRIALALGMEPIAVIAEIRAEEEKHPTKRQFWRDFLTRAAMVCGLVLALGSGMPASSEASTRSADRDVSANYARRAWRWLRARISITLAGTTGQPASPARSC